MKNFFFKLFTLSVFVIFTQNLQAQTISAADQKGIEACYNAFQSVFTKMDVTGIEAWLTEQAVQITPDGKITRGRANVVANMAGYLEYLKSQPKPEKMEVKNINWQNHYVAPDVILATYTEETTLQLSGQNRVEKMTQAIVLKKSNGVWQADLITLIPMVKTPEMGK
jgi:ketosteroid isomerase-like protein